MSPRVRLVPNAWIGLLWLGSLGLGSLCLSTGCVVQYGEPPEGMVLPADMLPPPVDFTEAVTRIDLMLEGEQDVDRLDRLLAMRDLSRRMRRADPRAQQEVLFYLQQMIAVEERAQPIETTSVYDDEVIASFTPLAAPIVEESLGEASVVPIGEPVPGVETAPVEAAPAVNLMASAGRRVSTPPESAPVEPTPVEATPEPVTPTPAPSSMGMGLLDVDAMMDRALAALDGGDPRGTMAQLEPCRGQPCWGKVDELWGLGRDAHVYAERERAGELFLRARAQTDVSMRVQTLVAVRQQLSDLTSSYPESRYAPAIRRNVRLVEREIEALGGGDQLR